MQAVYLKLFGPSGRIPVRLYVRNIDEDFDDLDDAPTVDSWEKISYINRPVEIQSEGNFESIVFFPMNFWVESLFRLSSRSPVSSYISPLKNSISVLYLHLI